VNWAGEAGDQTSANVFLEDFEPASPAWVYGDSDPTSGDDYWQTSTYRAYSGSQSAWSAGVGDQSLVTPIYSNDFESFIFPAAGWAAGDFNPTSGDDYWDDRENTQCPGSIPAIQGTIHLYVADVTEACRLTYDNDMQAYAAYGPVDLSGYGAVTLDFSLWMDIEDFWDYLEIQASTDGAFWTTYVTLSDGYDSVDGDPWAAAWFSYSYDLSSALAGSPTAYIRLLFTSDGSITRTGAYIDLLSLNGRPLNTVARLYDNDMYSYMYQPVDLSPYTSAVLTYWYWLDSEACCDYLEVIYFDGATWYYLDQHYGTSFGWAWSSVTIPSSAVSVGFGFYSDGSIVAEGAYVDYVSLDGTLPNNVLHQYDDFMDTTMTHVVDLSAYPEGRIDYWYWLDSEVGFDYLEVTYYDGFTWNYVDHHEGNSGGWVSSSVTLPNTVTQVGFLFHSDGSVRREGAYVDDVQVFGVIPPPTCSASASATSGVEGVTTFDFTGGASGGQPPYTWSWDFGDLTTDTNQNPSHLYATAGVYNATLTVTDIYPQTCTATVAITVDHGPPTSVVVDPPAPSVAENTSQPFTAQVLDSLGHDVTALWTIAWSVSAPPCGTLSVATGNTTNLTAGATAGGSGCQVNATASSVTGTADVTVTHGPAVSLSVSPSTSTVVEGATRSFSAAILDAAGHDISSVASVTWSVSPGACGSMSGSSGSGTLNAGASAGGSTCTVSAASGGVSDTASVDITHGAPATVTVSPPTAPVVEGLSQLLTATVRDLANHDITADVTVSWIVTPAACGTLSAATGGSTTLITATAAGGTICTVTASVGGLQGSAVVTVIHGVPATITLSPATGTVVEGGAVSFTATVRDLAGHDLTANSTIAWAVAPATCGTVSPSSGATTTLTTAGSAGGAPCAVSATSGVATGAAAVTVNRSLVLPIVLGVILLVVILLVLLLLLMRRRKKQAAALAGTPGAMPPGTPTMGPPTTPYQPMAEAPMGPAAATASPVAEQFAELQRLKEQGLISEQEYEASRRRLLEKI